MPDENSLLKKFSKNKIEWGRLTKYFQRIPIDSKTPMNDSIYIKYGPKGVCATIVLSGKKILMDKKCYSVVFDCNTELEAWSKSVKEVERVRLQHIEFLNSNKTKPKNKKK